MSAERVATIHVGFEVESGEPVAVPLGNTAVTGQTQASGKTTTLEALVSRSGVTALAFVTKRGESAFSGGRRVQPYFRDRADWQFVTSIIDATLQEKNKFLRPWIMKITRTTRTLAEVQDAVRAALKSSRDASLNEGVYTQLDAYLDLIVPEIARTPLAARLDLAPGLNVMDVSGSPTPMQMLFVQSALDWVNEYANDTVVIVPEAWEFIPEGKGSPVKSSAVTLVRKGSGIGNHIWVDSQDMAGVDKVILRGCPVWLIGVQRESNEIRRNLANIPKSIKRPSAAAVAMLEQGQFYVCWGSHAVKTYVQPAWLSAEDAYAVALGEAVPLDRIRPRATPKATPKENTVNETEARELRAENDRLRRCVEDLQRQLRRSGSAESSNDKAAASAPPSGRPVRGDAGSTPVSATSAALATHESPASLNGLYEEFRRRLLAEPAVLRVLALKPELNVEVKRAVVEVDGASLKGRIARLIAARWFDGEGRTQGATRTELRRTGPDPNAGNVSTVFSQFVKDGFLTAESGNLYRSVSDMKVNIVER